MEGTVLGVRSLAMSQAVGGRNEKEDIFACAARHGPPLLKRLVDVGWPAGVLLNINFPPLPPAKVARIAVVAQGQRDQSMLRVDERVDARGRTYFWVGFKRIFSDPEMGTDLRAIHEGQISITPLQLNLTEWREQERLSGLLEGPVSALKKRTRRKMEATPAIAEGWGNGRFRAVEPSKRAVKRRASKPQGRG
jgi:5'-nucleotidase